MIPMVARLYALFTILLLSFGQDSMVSGCHLPFEIYWTLGSTINQSWQISKIQMLVEQ
jgi:hypothetical protein